MFTNIAVFLVVLGVLVFVHEMGHFIAAKMCGVYVDRFSLGMPPRIFGIRLGGTDYCIGLLPIGGYVKMAGQEDSPLSDEEREETYGHVPPEQWYNNKSKSQRAFILIAGPAMNMVLAFFIYLGMAAFGSYVPAATLETRIGEIRIDSPASKAPMYESSGGAIDFSGEPDTNGWKVGDRILTINGSEVIGFQDILVSSVLGEGKTSSVVIERTNHDGSTTRYVSRIKPERETPDVIHATFGIMVFQSALIEHVLSDSPADNSGLKKGDRIIKAGGEWVDTYTFSNIVQDTEPGQALDLELIRGDETLSLNLTTVSNGTFKDINFKQPLGMVVAIRNNEPQPILLENSDFQKRTGLRPKELIATVNGETDIGTQLRSLIEKDPESEIEVTVLPASTKLGESSDEGRTVTASVIDIVNGLTGVDPTQAPEIARISDEAAEATGLKRRDVITHIDGQEATVALLEDIRSNRIGESIPITVHRPSFLFGFYQKEETFEAELTVDSVQRVGVVWSQEKIFHKQELANVIPYAYNECVRRSTEIGKTLHRLVTGGISPKLLGGPVLIYEITTQSARLGIYELLAMIAMISVNLCIFNLLPLPVLDGGQLTIIAIEAIRRRPVSARILEGVQSAGLIFILGLLLFVTFNDVSRIFERWLP